MVEISPIDSFLNFFKTKYINNNIKTNYIQFSVNYLGNYSKHTFRINAMTHLYGLNVTRRKDS